MKASEVLVGRTYLRVKAGQFTRVYIDRARTASRRVRTFGSVSYEPRAAGWMATNLATNRAVAVKSAATLVAECRWMTEFGKDWGVPEKIDMLIALGRVFTDISDKASDSMPVFRHSKSGLLLAVEHIDPGLRELLGPQLWALVDDSVRTCIWRGDDLAVARQVMMRHHHNTKAHAAEVLP